jgi:hypothetical protein
MTTLRRFLVVQMLMLWQGGFLFYSAVVVTYGTKVLGSSFEQGRITRLVTQTMNLIGAVALVVFAWDLVRNRAPLRRQRIVLWACWDVMALCLIALFLIHPHLDRMVNFDAVSGAAAIADRPTFKFWHRTYLWVSTAQWIAGLVFAATLLRSWMVADRAHGFGNQSFPDPAPHDH